MFRVYVFCFVLAFGFSPFWGLRARVEELRHLEFGISAYCCGFFGFWILDLGLRISFRVLGFGVWVFDFGLWALGKGVRVLLRGLKFGITRYRLGV